MQRVGARLQQHVIVRRRWASHAPRKPNASNTKASPRRPPEARKGQAPVKSNVTKPPVLRSRPPPREPPPPRKSEDIVEQGTAGARQTDGQTDDAVDYEPQKPNRGQQWKRPGTIGAYVFVGVLGYYLVQLFVAARQPCRNPRIKDLDRQKDVSRVYDSTADSFDTEVGLSETVMRIKGIRKSLARMCKGDVLEVSCGTGRNLGYFDLRPDGQVDSLTFLDLSPQMIDVCKRKWATLYGRDTGGLKQGLVVRFLAASAGEPMPLAPGGKRYTTIFQTIGLCSMERPQEMLVNLSRHLDYSDPEARILLLEHGRSYLPWLNNVLDNAAEKHAERHGCWFNRDIGALVEAAAAEAGLEVVRERRKHLGTTWLFELKVKDGITSNPVQDVEGTPQAEAVQRSNTGLLEGFWRR